MQIPENYLTLKDVSGRDPSLLLSNCIGLFTHVGFGPSLEEDYLGLPLKLHVLQCRLLRWKHLVYDTSVEGCLPAETEKLTQDILQSIVAAFKTAHLRSEYYLTNTDNSLEVVSRDVAFTDVKTDETLGNLRDQLHAINKARFSKVQLIDKERLMMNRTDLGESLIDRCSGLIKDLESISGISADNFHALATDDIQDITEAVALAWIRISADEIDPVMRRAVEEVAKNKLKQRDYQRFVDLRDSRLKRKTSRWCSGGNHVWFISGNANVHIGDTIRGNGFWN